MVMEVSRRVCDGQKLKYLVQAGLAWLQYNMAHVNKLNVYPVPDGDTGTNMWHTLRRAYQEVADSEDNHVGRVAHAIAHGALYGARGNSGTILSQLFSGFATGLKDREVFDSATLIYACKLAVESAYVAVEKPVEGTILTVARMAGEAAIRLAQEENDLQVILEVMLATAQDALRRTPDQLEVLRKAGVVDSGGQGFVYILEGMVRLLQGEPVIMFEMEHDPSVPAAEEGTEWEDVMEPEDEDGYGYDVQFLIKGENLSLPQIRAELEAMGGWSIVLGGTSQLVKVHVHLADPGKALSYGVTLGILDDLVVENMQIQYEQQLAKRMRKEAEEAPPVVEGVAVITVAAGDGVKRAMIRDLGAAYVISGGQTMNPSAEDFLNAINSIPNTEIVLLPNNSNIILTAKQAAQMAQHKRVTVVPSKTLPQGVSALIAYGNAHSVGADLDDITAEMRDALSIVRTIEVTTSTRAISMDGVTTAEGQIIGLLDDKLAASGESIEDVVHEMLMLAQADRAELITVYYGWDVRESQANKMAEQVRERFNSAEVQVVRGGQPLYPYIISVE